MNQIIKQLPSGVYSVITNNKVEIYTEKEFSQLYAFSYWWKRVSKKYFNG
jgi:hypothetical protein